MLLTKFIQALKGPLGQVRSGLVLMLRSRTNAESLANFQPYRVRPREYPSSSNLQIFYGETHTLPEPNFGDHYLARLPKK